MVLNHRLLLILAVSLVLSFSKWGKRIIYPLQIFTTWVHECGHATVATLLGGTAVKITLSPDTSGLTQFRIPPGRLRQAFIASAGYLGASLFGCVLFIATEIARDGRWFTLQNLTVVIALMIAVTTVFWVRNAFGWFCMALLGCAFASLAYPPMSRFTEEVLFFLAIQTTLNALFDIRTLFSLGRQTKGAMSDAHTLQKLFFLPSWFWALFWLTTSAALIYWTILPRVVVGLPF